MWYPQTRSNKKLPEKAGRCPPLGEAPSRVKKKKVLMMLTGTLGAGTQDTKALTDKAAAQGTWTVNSITEC